MRKLVCQDITCKYHGYNNVCQKATVEINFARCLSFEKGFGYYIQLVYEKLHSTNMILPTDLNDDLRLGLYYVMETFDLKLIEREHGDWRWLMLVDENGKGLKTAEIIERELNMDKLTQHSINFENGILPNANVKKKKPKKEFQPFGWLSPTGDFTEGSFGDHEQVAYDIITEKKFRNEWRNDSDFETARDFLSEVKGYVLIHNPSGFGNYIVSHVKPLTKKQKEFLYGYFMDMGDSLKAERYLTEED